MTTESAAPKGRARVLAALQKANGRALCAACGALAGGLSLLDARSAMADLSSSGEISVTLAGVCGVCGRRQDVMATRNG